MNKGVISMGIKCPIIRQGDDLVKIVTDSVLDAITYYMDGIDASVFDNRMFDLNDKDVICITESIVARAQGNYVTVDDIVQFLKEHNYNKELCLAFPIMSRNRFSLILRAFARYADKLSIYLSDDVDEQGNPIFGVNPFTGVDIQKYYKQICEEEHCELTYLFNTFSTTINISNVIDCRCHPLSDLSLKDIMNEPVKRIDGTISGFNHEWGLLGSNKANEETLKLFPDPMKAQQLVDSIQHNILSITGTRVEVMIYGDGCFKDPVGGIWEFADPVTSPAWTSGLTGCPNEIKLKNFADDTFKDLNGEELTKAMKTKIQEKNDNLINSMSSQGTTPRRYIDLLASLADLTSGSGDKGTPIVLIKNYFKNFANE